MTTDEQFLIQAHPALFEAADLASFEREILANSSATEHDASRFFQRFPKFLLLGQGNAIRREVVLVEANTGLRQRVDFFRRTYGQSYWDIIELKSPNVPALTRPKRGHPRPSSAVYDALHQAEDYRNMIDQNASLRADLAARGLTVFRPQFLVVVGRADQAIPPDTMRDLYDRIKRGPAEFRTYDDLHRFAAEHYAASKLIVVPTSMIHSTIVRMPALTLADVRRILERDAKIPSLEAAALAGDLAATLRTKANTFEVETWRGTSHLNLRFDGERSARSRIREGSTHHVETAVETLAILAILQELQLRVHTRLPGVYGHDYVFGPLHPMADTFEIGLSGHYEFQFVGMGDEDPRAMQRQLNGPMPPRSKNPLMAPLYRFLDGLPPRPKRTLPFLRAYVGLRARRIIIERHP